MQGLFADLEEDSTTALTLGAHDMHAPLVVVAGEVCPCNSPSTMCVRGHKEVAAGVRAREGLGRRGGTERERTARGMSIRKLAEEAGVSTETIYSLEHGRRDFIWPKTARKLADALGIDPDDLYR